jgi:hypothetical protein
MISYRQIKANRRNALNSTGPKTEAGSVTLQRRPPGLTAETVLSALEDAEDYKAFEAAIIADYDAQSAVERRTRAVIGEHSVAAAPRHEYGYRTVRDSSSPTA